MSKLPVSVSESDFEQYILPYLTYKLNDIMITTVRMLIFAATYSEMNIKLKV